MTDRAMPPAEGPAAPPSPPSRDAANVSAVSAAVLGAALTIGALALFGTRAALSVGAGATIAVANLVTMSAIIRAMLRSGDDAEAEPNTNADANADADAVSADHVAEGKRGGAAWGAFALLKILLLFGGVWLLLTRGVVDPIPLVAGYGVLPLGITVGGLVTSLAPRSRRAGRRSRTK